MKLVAWKGKLENEEVSEGNTGKVSSLIRDNVRVHVPIYYCICGRSPWILRIKYQIQSFGVKNFLWGFQYVGI